MRVLVTGGAGTLGSEYVQRALDQGKVEKICVIDNFRTSSRKALPTHSELLVHEGDIGDRRLVQEVFNAFHPDVVLHAAASYADPGDWEGDVSANVIGTINVLRACESTKVERIVNLQTVLCYGRPETLPISESAPLRPRGSYAISKVAAELFVEQSPTQSISLRIGSVLSPELSIGPLPTFYRQLKAGEPCSVTPTVRDFLDPDDFFALLHRAMEPGRPTGVFNVSAGIGRSMIEIYDLVSAYLGVAREPTVTELQMLDVPAIVLDSTLAQSVFDWKPQVPFEESVHKVLDAYEVSGVGEIFSHLR